PSGKPFMWILFPLLCTLSPRRSDTGGLRGEIAHSGDTWRGSPLPVAYRGDHRPVTVCHSGFVPSCPRAGRLSEKGRPVMSSDRLTGDRAISCMAGTREKTDCRGVKRGRRGEKCRGGIQSTLRGNVKEVISADPDQVWSGRGIKAAAGSLFVKAGEEAEGHELSGWERMENGGRFTRNQWVPQSLFTSDPAGMVPCISPRSSSGFVVGVMGSDLQHRSVMRRLRYNK
ncbi:hypothetical protein KUCAC02_027483, partial [Chaenocephalus aceratus]